MANRTWIGRAGVVRQSSPFTLGGTLAAGSTFTATINTRAVVYTCTGSDTATTAAAALAAAAQAAGVDFPEFGELAWASSGAVLTVTGPADGAPFTLTVVAGGSGSPSATAGTVVAATGPHHWDNANNWAEGSVPASTDDVVIDDGVSIKYGLAQSAVTLASLTVRQGFPADAQIGLPARNENGYAEYRPQRLHVNATVCHLDTRSAMVRLNLHTAASTVTVQDSGRAEAGRFAVDLLANNSGTVVRVNRGQVGVAANANETATVSAVRVSYRDQRQADADVTLGPGLTVATVEHLGGTVLMRCGCTTYVGEGGTLRREGSGAVATFDNRGARVDDFSTGTITTFRNGGQWWRRGAAPLTITNAYLYGGGSTTDASGWVTHTNAAEFVQCGPPAAPGDTENEPAAVHYWNFGYGRKLTPVDV